MVAETTRRQDDSLSSFWMYILRIRDEGEMRTQMQVVFEDSTTYLLVLLGLIKSRAHSETTSTLRKT